jgi:hypothetical protein
MVSTAAWADVGWGHNHKKGLSFYCYYSKTSALRRYFTGANVNCSFGVRAKTKNLSVIQLAAINKPTT